MPRFPTVFHSAFSTLAPIQSLLSQNQRYKSPTMGYPETATGFAIKDQKKWTEFEKYEYPLKKFEDRDIDVAIDCCGVCASDVLTINGGWGECPLPLVVGHEIVSILTTSASSSSSGPCSPGKSRHRLTASLAMDRSEKPSKLART